MKRLTIALTISAVAVLGLVGCSSAPATSTPDSSTSAPAEQKPSEAPAAEQTIAEACVDLAGPMAEAATTMSALGTAANDPQAAVDAWTALTDAYQKFADNVSNADVKAAAVPVAADVAAVRDILQKVYVDGDMGAAGEIVAASNAMQESQTALQNLCAG